MINNSLEILVNGNDVTTELLRANGSLFYANGTADINRLSGNNLEVSFMSGISVGVKLKSGILSFIVKLTENFRGKAHGLLGNFDSDATNEFVYKNGTTIPDGSTDKEIHNFGQSCEKLKVPKKMLWFQFLSIQGKCLTVIVYSHTLMS